MHRRLLDHGTRARRVLVVCYVLGIMMITLLPTPGTSESHVSLRLLPFTDIGRLRFGRGTLNAVGNVLMFVPLGMIISRRSFIRVLLLAGLASLAIELAQLGLSLWAHADRTTSTDDVILNISGAAVGYAVSTAWRWSRRASRDGTEAT